MFKPSDLEKMPVELEKYMAELELRIMKDIVRRIKINDEITRSADWQIYRLNQLGESKRVIKKEIEGMLNLSTKEINHLYKDVIRQGYARDESLYKAKGKPMIRYEDNKELQQLINATVVQTKQEMINITQSLGFSIQQNGKLEFTELSEYYQKVLDNAMFDITSGAFDYNSTLKRVVSEMTKSGLRTVDYANGWTNRVEVAARRSLMSGVTQVTNRINEMNAKELDTEHFEVSWHSTARPEHQLWQGRVYTKAELVSVCGLGSITGLCGANCYHSYYPFLPGISERLYTDEQLEEMNTKENTPKEYNGKEYTSYDAAQRQRSFETLMRKQRKDIVLLKHGEASIEDIQSVQARYRESMRQYVDFSRRMDLPQQKERIYLDGLGKVG